LKITVGFGVALLPVLVGIVLAAADGAGNAAIARVLAVNGLTLDVRPEP